jgi:hypothetical protein
MFYFKIYVKKIKKDVKKTYGKNRCRKNFQYPPHR